MLLLLPGEKEAASCPLLGGAGGWAGLWPGSGEPPFLLLSSGSLKAGFYPPPVEKGLRKVGCLLSDRAPLDQARAMPML